MSTEQIAELLYQALETEKGGIQVYETALRCVQNADLKKEWEEYLEQTQKHEQIVLETLETFGLDPETETPGRKVVRHIGESLVKAMELALQANKPAAAELVACECVVVPRALDQVPRHEGSATTARRGEGRENCHRGSTRKAGAPGIALERPFRTPGRSQSGGRAQARTPWRLR
jgi:hypothetical protein